MKQIYETRRGNLIVSTDPARLNLDAVCDFLTRAYWARTRPRAATERAFANSLVFGIYEGERQIGMARVVSDYTTFAYLCDVFIHEDYRGRGLGKWLMETIHGHPDLQGLRRWALLTSDAHGLYQQFGWSLLANPERWMEKFSG